MVNEVHKSIKWEFYVFTIRHYIYIKHILFAQLLHNNCTTILMCLTFFFKKIYKK
jgi:hypothetical protein